MEQSERPATRAASELRRVPDPAAEGVPAGSLLGGADRLGGLRDLLAAACARERDRRLFRESAGAARPF